MITTPFVAAVSPSPPPRLAERIRACWLGKNIGGTLGGPHEGKPGPLALSFYDPVPTAALPNDDLDLQVVWLQFLLAGGHRHVTPDLLAEAWVRHVRFPFDEYGVALRNHALGLRGIARGATDNFFGECMGGAIRSELWACLAAGDPARASGLAWADASVDHCGDGVYAEVFHAALQAAAFAEPNRETLLDTALAFVPPATRLGAALRFTRERCRSRDNWQRTRDEVVRRYATGNFTDVVCNLCFELIGWYAGGGDFGRSLCIAVNCGFDTDCTGATLGALLGILDPDAIPRRWSEPIGENIKISPEIVGLRPPADLAELTELTLRLREQLAGIPAPLGPIAPHLPPRSPVDAQPVSGQVAEAAVPVLAGPAAPAASAWRQLERGGTWWRFDRTEFAAPVKLIRLAFQVERPEPLKLMAWFPPGLTAWVDGRRCLQYQAGELAGDAFAAPSFHRAGIAACIFAQPPLPPGSHELLLALPRPAPPAADLVFGLADAATNLWLPHAFSRT